MKYNTVVIIRATVDSHTQNYNTTAGSETSTTNMRD